MPFVALTLALSVPGWAQEPGPLTQPWPAQLWIEAGVNGSVRATLTLAAANPPAGLHGVLARAMGCAEAERTPSPDEYRIQVQCSMDRSSRLGFRLNTRLEEVASVLRAAGAGGVEVLITAGNFGWVRVNPAIRREGILSSAIYQRSYELAEIPSAIQIEAGFEESSLRTLGVGILGLLLLPFLMLVLRPTNQLQLHAMVQALVLAGCVGWIWTLQHNHAFAMSTLLLPRWSYAPLLALTAAPLLAVWAGSRLAGARYSQLKPEGTTAGTGAEQYRRVKFWMGATLACLFSGFISLLSATEASAGPFGALLANLLPAALCVARLLHVARGDSRPLQKGELHARIFALAARAGVSLRGVTVLTPASRAPVALATRWGTVMMSESMLARFSRSEVDAIVCHELSHVHSGPGGAIPKGMRMVMWFLIAGTILAAQFLTGIADSIPVLMIAAYFLFKLWRRSGERKADADSVRWSGDPEALIMGLARMSYAHNFPLEWSAPTSWFVSHPSTMERLESIARAGGVLRSRLGELVEEARRDPADVYFDKPDLTDAALGDDAAFTPAMQRSLQTRIKWFGLFSPLAIALPIAWLLQRMGMEGLGLLVLGTVAAMASFYIGLELIIGSVRAKARQRAAAKCGDGVFVGLSLATGPRIYNGMFHYDFGMVRTTGGSLEFVGDRVHFALDRRLVTRVWLGDGPRHYTPRKVVCVEYRPSPGAPLAVFTMQSFEARLWPNTVAAARRLKRQVETWGSGVSNTDVPPLPCTLPEESGETEAAMPLWTALKAAIMYFAIALAMDTSSSAFAIGREWDPWQMFVPALVCAGFCLFVFFPRMRWAGASARVASKAEVS